MKQKTINEAEVSQQFTSNLIKHLSNATAVQKQILLNKLLERPPEGKAIEYAKSICNGLTETELLNLLATLQKQFDKDTWQFMTRWRT